MSLGFEKLRVLLIDDNRHMRSIARALLEGFGVMEIRDVASASEGLNVARTWAAVVALVDFKMEHLNGVQFTRLIRTAPDSRNPYLPIIIMTGHAGIVRVVEARDAGVTEFIAKPLSAKTLLNRLNSVIYQPRAFVRTQTYFGPDRRRRSDPAHQGPWRRFDDIRAPASTASTLSISPPMDENDTVWLD
jgi:two-component system chemotaxis response regulator CheY